MDSSWVEVLPLPKSRPGWMAAILLFLLWGLVFLSIQPKLATTVVKDIDSSATFYFDSSASISHIVYPKALNPDSTIPIKLMIQSGGSSSIQIQSISVVWYCYKYFGDELLVYDFHYVDYKVLPVVSNEAVVNFQIPDCGPIKTSYIQGVFSINSKNSDASIILPNYVYIELNQWQAIRNSILDALASQYGFIGIAVLALISVWLVEQKNHQDMWLSNRDGWDAARQTFFRALIRFLIILVTLIAVLIANNHIGGLIVVILLVILLTWLFEPNLLSLWTKLRNRHESAKRQKELAKEGVKNETGTSSPAKSRKTRSAKDGNPSRPSSLPQKIEAPRTKTQK